jgi:hypothetical protein
MLLLQAVIHLKFHDFGCISRLCIIMSLYVAFSPFLRKHSRQSARRGMVVGSVRDIDPSW